MRPSPPACYDAAIVPACIRINSSSAAQYLATDGDAPRLTPTIPTVIYHFDPSSVGERGISQSGSMEVKGQQGLAKLLPQVNLLFAAATDALFGNSTALAAVEVRTHPSPSNSSGVLPHSCREADEGMHGWQAFKPDIMLATTMFPAVPVLASRLNISFVNYFPAGAIEPFFTTLYRGSNRRAFLPNPLSYMPQVDLPVTSQHLVRCPTS